MDKLREEIIESQKSRSDLVKWKLLIVSALGAIGFGTGFPGVGNACKPILGILFLIPFVSLYVDILCYHLALRMIVIGAFLKSSEIICEGQSSDFKAELTFLQKYENFAADTRGDKLVAFDLEDWALWYSTRALSVIVSIIGIADALSPDMLGDNSKYNIYTSASLIVGGITGWMLAGKLYRRFKQKSKALEAAKAG